MTYQAMIVDDEKINIKFLSKLISMYCPEIEIVATATNVNEGVAAVNKFRPAMLFLDIEIHDMTGFDLLDMIDPYPVQVILVSAHDKYAFKAFKFAVLDYLLKPVSIEELIAVVKRAKLRIADVTEKENNTKPNIVHAECLSVHHKDHIELVYWKDIVHLDASGGYTFINTVESKKVISSKSLKETESSLPKGQFLRIHNSHIVNIAHVSKINKGRYWSLQMRNGIEIPISPTCKQAVADALNL